MDDAMKAVLHESNTSSAADVSDESGNGAAAVLFVEVSPRHEAGETCGSPPEADAAGQEHPAPRPKAWWGLTPGAREAIAAECSELNAPHQKEQHLHDQEAQLVPEAWPELGKLPAPKKGKRR